jgi:DNA polymerase-1
VKTIFNRRIYIPELKMKSSNMVFFGRRVAYNAPIQGSAADIIKLAMINLNSRLSAEKLASKIILQVHDEIIVHAPKEEQEQVVAILRNEMETVLSLAVPLQVVVGCGASWCSAKI